MVVVVVVWVVFVVVWVVVVVVVVVLLPGNRQRQPFPLAWFGSPIRTVKIQTKYNSRKIILIFLRISKIELNQLIDF